MHIITLNKVKLILFFSFIFFGFNYFNNPVFAVEGTCTCELSIQKNPDDGMCVFPTKDNKGVITSPPERTYSIKDKVNFRKLFESGPVIAGCPALAAQLLIPGFIDDKNDIPNEITKSKCGSKTIGGNLITGDIEYAYLLQNCKYKAPPSSGGSGGGAAGGADPAAGAPVAGAAESPVGAAAKNVDVFDSGNPDCNKVCQWIVENYSRPDYKGPIPPCAFTGQCRDVNVLVDFFIRQGKMLMGLIGMLGLAAFIYGGILMVFSFGNADKVGQGKEVMIAAVIGIIIVFSAYLAVAFLLKTVGVNPDLQAIK